MEIKDDELKSIINKLSYIFKEIYDINSSVDWNRISFLAGNLVVQAENLRQFANAKCNIKNKKK